MSIVKFNPHKQFDSADLAVLSFESATAEVLSRRQAWKERSVLYVLVLLMAFLVVFISVAHLDRIVVTTGRLVPIGGALTVQPLEKAIISRVLVSVGEIVKKGQVLATCDPTFAQANLAQLQQKVADLDAQKRRMESEEAGQPFRAEPSQSYDVLQASIGQERTTEFASGVSDFDQRIRSSEAQADGLRHNIDEYRAELKIAADTENIYNELVKSQAVSHLQLTAAQNQRIELERKVAEAESSLTSTEHLLESLKEQRRVYIEKWHDDDLNNLVSVKDQLEEARDDLTKAERLSELVNLVAPTDAIVLEIPQLSSGGVATDAQPLFSLMPLAAPLEVDAQIDAKDSGFVKVGDRATIKFEAYKFLEHGTADGVVKTISQDSFTQASSQDTVTNKTDETRSPYFDARITVTALHLHDVPPDARLIPGMTLQADIVVGRRTILWYLVGGALRSGSEAMHEP
jgi:HlyD family type I secretion membrane fusion protein